MSSTPPVRTSAIRQFATQILTLPRWARWVTVIVFALALTLVITPVIDNIYTNNFFDVSTVIIPALISAGLGIVMCVVGWWLLIGVAGSVPAPRAAAGWYFIIGMLLLLVVLFLIFTGLANALQG